MDEDPLRRDYERRKAALSRAARSAAGPLRVRKATTSNLFRYQRRDRSAAAPLDFRKLDRVIAVDRNVRVLEVEGAATYERIVRATLASSLLPTVTPELKHITIGGALVGIGIESTGSRHGFVHDGLIEAEVLLASGEVVRCTPENAFSDLFYALPNSYGSLGYVLKAQVKLIEAAAFVRIENTAYADMRAYLEALAEASRRGDADFVEGLIFSKAESYLTVGRFTSEPGGTPFDIYGIEPYYRALRRSPVLFLSAEDYIFRYDPDWFWNVPETRGYGAFRRIAPRWFRSTKFYNRYVRAKNRLGRALGAVAPQDEEQVIQDWQVPWPQARAFVSTVLDTLPLEGRPCVALPIRTRGSPTLYPVRAGELYFNLGCYCWVKKPPGQKSYEYTRILDEACFAAGGIKMLYSSSFLDQAAFDRIYSGDAYRALKRKYDPHDRLPSLYEKAVLMR